MSFRLMRALTTALLALSVGGCVSQNVRDDVRSVVKPASKRNPAPDFEVKDANGQAFRLADYKGKVVLLNFWATWCGPCKVEIPWFIDFEKNYKDRGFAVVGISLDDDGWEAVKPYIEERKMNYRVALGNMQIERLYNGGSGIEALPTSFIIDRDGTIAAVHVGLISKSNYQNELEELLH
jgi:peroxiredoxin